MKVLDASFLIDYLQGDEATKECYEANGGDAERWVMPVPAYAEALVGEGNFPDGDVEDVRAALAWGEKYAVDEHTAVLAGESRARLAPRGRSSMATTPSSLRSVANSERRWSQRTATSRTRKPRRSLTLRSIELLPLGRDL